MLPHSRNFFVRGSSHFYWAVKRKKLANWENDGIFTWPLVAAGAVTSDDESPAAAVGYPNGQSAVLGTRVELLSLNCLTT